MSDLIELAYEQAIARADTEKAAELAVALREYREFYKLRAVNDE